MFPVKGLDDSASSSNDVKETRTVIARYYLAHTNSHKTVTSHFASRPSCPTNWSPQVRSHGPNTETQIDPDNTSSYQHQILPTEPYVVWTQYICRLSHLFQTSLVNKLRHQLTKQEFPFDNTHPENIPQCCKHAIFSYFSK